MKRLWLPLTGGLLGLSFLLDVIFLHDSHPVFWWQAAPAFDFLYGLGGCALLILVAKWLGHSWLQRQKHYYQEEP